jgi:integrase
LQLADLGAARHRFQQRLTPHDFRRCAATTIAEYKPEEYHIIRAILGHSTGATADKHFVKAKATHAARAVQAAVIHRRKALAIDATLPQR